MAVFVVSYDLRKESSSFDYEPLYSELARLEAQKVNYSLWLINVDNTAREVVDHFKQFLDENDRLWASAVDRGRYSFVNARKGTNSWLSENLTSESADE